MKKIGLMIMISPNIEYNPTKIKPSISIISNYNNEVNIEIRDRISGLKFCQVTMTHSQFVDATMNRIAECDCVDGFVIDTDKLGKKRIRNNIDISFATTDNKIYSIDEKRELVKKYIEENPYGDGWYLQSLGNRDSFYEKDGYYWLRATFVKWVDNEDSEDI